MKNDFEEPQGFSFLPRLIMLNLRTTTRTNVRDDTYVLLVGSHTALASSDYAVDQVVVSQLAQRRERGSRRTTTTTDRQTSRYHTEHEFEFYKQ